jgi:hypothetical protein
MAKRVDPLKAKEAKQKKIAIGGAVLLLALLGFQGPKTLKMLSGPPPVTTPTSTSAAPASTTPGVTPATGAPPAGETPVAAAPELSAVADSDLSPEAVQGQLATFERFASKDPFAQQAEPVASAPARVSDPRDGTEKDPVDTKNDAKPAESAADADGAADGGFTTGGSTPAAPAIAAATSISVNGVAEDVAVEGSFPKDEPTFVLVKLAKNGKSVEIGIAGGEYAGGDDTITLTFGKKLTLQNTADGSRYELELRAVQGFAVPKKK